MLIINQTQYSRAIVILIIFYLVFCNTSAAQYTWNNDSAFKAGSPNSGRIWGYAFGDFAFKSHKDSLNRGGSSQYTGIPEARTTFQFRRIYFGYDYNISKKFSAELLLAAEDNFPAGNPPSAAVASGDELLNHKLTFYIKLMNIRWKNIWKGTDLVAGQIATPAYPLLSEKIWNYRSIERTISDIRRTPSYDLGASLQGVFDPSAKNVGYNLMVANGSGAMPEADNFKWFYGDVYAYFFHKKLILDAYGDYERLKWTTTWHHSRQMWKGYIAFNSAATDKGIDPGSGFTVGLEFFINNLKKDNFATKITGGVDTLSIAAKGISFYVHADIIKAKLRFIARFDAFNPNNKIDNNIYYKYAGNTSQYNDNSYRADTIPTGDQTYKQTFLVAGLDFMPARNVHFMPNIWYTHYATQLSASNSDHDLVYRISFYYVFGK
ncbi:MAG: hypothetical protein Q8941_24280 [Bacteroidota bacterium]|nr:hypothetical protein [Bacteroidota bacterium]